MTRPPILPRRFRIDLDALPRYWNGGSAFATHFDNALHLLFPEGERFFIRSVSHYLPRIEDPELRAQVKGFIAQEGHHGSEHERYFQRMCEWGYPVDRCQRELRFWIRLAERVLPPALRLSMTVGAEHMTASLADFTLRHPEYTTRTHPEMMRLWRWHAAEEIEHEAVAFDVLKQVRPSYPLRVLGLVIFMAFFWGVVTLWILRLWRSDGLPLRRIPAASRELEDWGGHLMGREVFGRGFLRYLRPSFHPHDRDHLHLARQALTDLELPVPA